MKLLTKHSPKALKTVRKRVAAAGLLGSSAASCETNCAASSKLRGITNAELPMVHFSRFLRGSFFGCINVNVCD